MKIAITVQTPEVTSNIPVALLCGSFTDKIRKLSTIKADGVELLTTNPRELDKSSIRQLLLDHSLETAAISSGGMFSSLGLTLMDADLAIAQQAKDRLYDLIDLAAFLKAPTVTLGSFRGRLIKGGEDAKNRFSKLIKEAGYFAYTKGVRIAIEAINRFETDFLFTAEEVLKFVDEIDEPGVGVLLDTFHVNIEEASWTKPFIDTLEKGKLFHVHLGDNNRLPPGQGLIDFQAIVTALHNGGYEGYLSAELLGKPDPDMAAKNTLEYMLPLIRRIQ